MKANAIARIIIWSMILVLLAGILFSVIIGVNFSEATPDVEVPVLSALYGTVTADTQVFNSPNISSANVGSLTSGDEVKIRMQETSNGENWTLITAPYSGWVLTDNIKIIQADHTIGPVASDESVSLGAVGAQKISNLEIDWAAGSITILPGTDTETIRFWDDYSGDDKYLLHYSTHGNTLKIRFCEADWDDFGFGIHFGTPFEKNLVIEVPESWYCEVLEIDAASSKLEVQDLHINEVEIDTASGAVSFENCNVIHLDVDTASGDVSYTGSLVTLECDAASASIVANLQNVPQSMDLDTASGNLDITLPENAGFSVKLDTLSGKFNSEFDYEVSNNRYICGNGGCTIDVSAMSGNVHIRKNANLTSENLTQPAAAHHAHTDSCVSDPGSCPEGGHVHSDSCATDPNCPDYHHENHH